MSGRLILLTGSTGYVGGRLLRRLESRGERIRCLVRDRVRAGRTESDRIELVIGDALDPTTLAPALSGVDVAFYLIHSMGAKGSFEEKDRQAAENFGRAAREAGVGRIVYLGGLGESGSDLSPHLRSRQEVGEVLRKSGVPVIELRASIVIGSGSLSFEMIRSLVERLPIMVTPRWVATRAQPIAVEDLLAYLVAAIDLPIAGSRVIPIGGSDQVSYGEIMREYARQRGLRRWLIPVPVLTPRLSSLWLGLVTPLYAQVGKALIESLRHPTLVDDPFAAGAFAIRPMGIQAAIARALQNEEQAFAETRWFDSLSSAGGARDWTGIRFGTRIVNTRSRAIEAAPDTVFRVICSIGGSRGWYFGDFLWRLRGWIDLLLGGVGMRRGRRHPQELRVGDALDCWRVEKLGPGRLLRLKAEMRLPGRAWLEFEVTGEGARSRARQTAVFDPVGLGGLLYWYVLYPAHEIVFGGMLRGIARVCEEERSPEGGKS